MEYRDGVWEGGSVLFIVIRVCLNVCLLYRSHMRGCLSEFLGGALLRITISTDCYYYYCGQLSSIEEKIVF